MAKPSKFVGTVIDPWVLNYTAYKVAPEDDSIGQYIDPIFLGDHIKLNWEK